MTKLRSLAFSTRPTFDNDDADYLFFWHGLRRTHGDFPLFPTRQLHADHCPGAPTDFVAQYHLKIFEVVRTPIIFFRRSKNTLPIWMLFFFGVFFGLFFCLFLVPFSSSSVCHRQSSFLLLPIQGSPAAAALKSPEKEEKKGGNVSKMVFAQWAYKGIDVLCVFLFSIFGLGIGHYSPLRIFLWLFRQGKPLPILLLLQLCK